MQKYVRIVVLSVFLITTLTGCSGNSFGANGYRTLDFTLVDYKNIPQKLMEQMETKMEEGFQLTYKEDEYLYIAKGYGEQETSGYSVAVTNLTTENEVVYFESKLLEPQENENVNHNSSFPYVVIKTELIEFPVIFK